MTGPTFDIVCTTIGDGSFLKHYGAAITEADAQDRVRIIVIPDRKTPAALYEAVADTRAQGFTVECPDLSEQEQFLASLGAPAGMFPFDTDHRRNIGYLMAWRDGADIMVSVDDDNLPRDGKWLNEHAQVVAPRRVRDVTGHVGRSTAFWNPCELLDAGEMTPRPRGFPYAGSHLSARVSTYERTCEIAVNAGLWIGDPDVDAITRLALHPESTSLNGSAVLGTTTWAPVNSQNTAIRREVIPAYYFFRSGRFGDIYQGYLVQACAKAMGHSVRFGTPAVTHARNDHDLLRDLQLELPDILILDRWLDWLTSAKPESGTYWDAYASLADQMQGWSHSQLEEDPWMSMASQMRWWLTLIRKIGA